jgi:hypothetical protein
LFLAKLNLNVLREDKMKNGTAIVALVMLCPLMALGRAVQMLDMPTLISESTLVFVGRVTKVEPSGITTTMTYPTWEGVTFEWLNCDVEVAEPIKGVGKGDHIRVVMLSVHVAVELPPYVPGDIVQTVIPSAPKIKRARPMFNAPGMVKPTEGRAYLLCLAPSTLSNTFAAVTAPWDDNQAIFVLDRSFWLYQNYRKNGKETFPALNERYGVLWSLVDEDGTLLPPGANSMRSTYKEAIATTAPTNLVIHLLWRTVKSSGGWQWDVPKGNGNGTNAAGGAAFSGGPVTMPGR